MVRTLRIKDFMKSAFGNIYFASFLVPLLLHTPSHLFLLDVTSHFNSNLVPQAFFGIEILMFVLTQSTFLPI